MKHKHSEVMHAFADGIECEYWSLSSKCWIKILCSNAFDFADEVRLKPEPKADVVKYLYRELSGFQWFESCYNYNVPILKLIYDGETGKLKDAKVIK